MKNIIFDTMELWSNTVEQQEEAIKEDIESGYTEYMELEDIQGVALDSANDVYAVELEDSLSYIEETIQKFISRYQKRYRTNIEHVAFIGTRSSHYGGIGGAGVKVGRMIAAEDLKEVFYGEQFSIGITDENTLQLSSHDHDGSNHMEMVLITAKESEAVERAHEGYQTHEDYLIYLDEKGKQPTRLDKAFTGTFESVEEAVYTASDIL